jgi:hypothetical protein
VPDFLLCFDTIDPDLTLTRTQYPAIVVNRGNKKVVSA